VFASDRVTSRFAVLFVLPHLTYQPVCILNLSYRQEACISSKEAREKAAAAQRRRWAKQKAKTKGYPSRLWVRKPEPRGASARWMRALCARRREAARLAQKAEAAQGYRRRMVLTVAHRLLYRVSIALPLISR
jgi:hypothetical protein